jgi:similar to stage IV sporulation protein
VPLIKLLRFLRGYHCFCAAEGFPERFLNLCNQAGIAVWDIAWHKGALRGKTDRRGYRRMRTCAEPAGVRLTEIKRTGLPFLLHSYRYRCGMPAGFLVCVATLAVLSQMIWTIEVTGNQRVAAEDILTVAASLGIRPGAWRKNINARDVSQAALRQLPVLTWLAVNLRGSSAVIEVREALLPNPRDEQTPQNIIARKAGQIKIIEVYSGSQAVRPGQAVLPGDLLAGSAVANADATHRYVRASAYAVARTNIVCRGAALRQTAPLRMQKKRTHYTLCLLQFSIPIGPRPKPNSAAITFEDHFTWEPKSTGKHLPLSLLRRTEYTYAPQPRGKTDSQLQLAAAAAFFAAEWETLRAAQVLRQEVRLHVREDACEIWLQGTAYENIGVAEKPSG